MIQAIVYTSNTGYTAEYARMLGEKTGLPVLTLNEAKKSLPVRAPILYLGWLMAGSLLFVLSCQAVGILFVGLLPVMRHAINLSAFYGILALTLCGFSFPIEAMPPVFQYWAAGFPVRHYMHIFQSQILAGFGFRYAYFSYICLLLFLLLPLAIIRRLKSALIYQNLIENKHKT